MPKLELLSEELNKPDLWDNPTHAGKISREHGSIMSKMKGVLAFERELIEHIDMINLAREDNDAETEAVGLSVFLLLGAYINVSLLLLHYFYSFTPKTTYWFFEF